MPGSVHPVSGSPDEVVDALAAWLDADAEPEPLVVETSGSTGVPKRVRLSRAAVRASGAATTQTLGASGQWLLMVPATYVAGVQVIARSLAAGHRPVIAGERDLASAAAELTPGVAHFVSLVPTQLHRLLDDPAAVAVLRGFHTVLLGGGPIDPALRTRAEAAQVAVVATYGSAETAGGCVYDGVALPGVRLAIGDGGRVLIAGPTLFDGYVDDPEATAAVLRDGWFHTSDAGTLAGGRLQLIGRIDDMVVTGGLNVPAPAVARTLAAHPALAEVVVLGVDDAEWGQRLVAFVVGAPGVAAVAGAPDCGVDLAAARDWVEQRHPRAWAPRQLVHLAQLPLLPNGKTDRLALRALAKEQA